MQKITTFSLRKTSQIFDQWKKYTNNMFLKKICYKNSQQITKLKFFRLWKKRASQKINLHLWLSARAKELITEHYANWRKRVLEKEKNKFRSKILTQVKCQKIFSFMKNMIKNKKSIERIQKSRQKNILAKFWDKWKKRMTMKDVEKLSKLRRLQKMFLAWKGWWERKKKMKGFCREYYENVLKRYDCIK